MAHTQVISFFFFFNDTATTEIYTLSLHDALPIFLEREPLAVRAIGKNHGIAPFRRGAEHVGAEQQAVVHRSEEHTSELQSQSNLVCRLLLEKKKQHRTANCSSSQTYGRLREFTVT